MYRLQIVLINPCPCLHVFFMICSCSMKITLTPVSFFFLLATRMKREWFPFSLSQTVPSPLRQGQGPLKSPCPSVRGSVPPLTPLMPRGRTGSSWLKSSTLTGMSYGSYISFSFFIVSSCHQPIAKSSNCFMTQLVCFVKVELQNSDRKAEMLDVLVSPLSKHCPTLNTISGIQAPCQP